MLINFSVNSKEVNNIMNDYVLFGDEFTNKDSLISEIVKRSLLLTPSDCGLVYDYGKNGDLKLIIIKDCDYNLSVWIDKWENPSNPDNSGVVCVDKAKFSSVYEISLFAETLNRVWNEEYDI